MQCVGKIILYHYNVWFVEKKSLISTGRKGEFLVLRKISRTLSLVFLLHDPTQLL